MGCYAIPCNICFVIDITLVHSMRTLRNSHHNFNFCSTVKWVVAFNATTHFTVEQKLKSLYIGLVCRLRMYMYTVCRHALCSKMWMCTFEVLLIICSFLWCCRSEGGEAVRQVPRGHRLSRLLPGTPQPGPGSRWVRP